MRHKLCRSFHPWCPGVKNRCLYFHFIDAFPPPPFSVTRRILQATLVLGSHTRREACHRGHRRHGGDALEQWRLVNIPNPPRGHTPPGGGGGYSLCDGWYICAAVLTPFFHFGRIEHDLFGVFFLIQQHKNDLLGTNPRKIRSFWPQNTIFPSIFLGPIFSGPRHTHSNFRTEYPPPPPPPPPGIRRNNNVIITPKRRRFDVIMTLLLTCAPRRSIVLQFFWSARKCL